MLGRLGGGGVTAAASISAWRRLAARSSTESMFLDDRLQVRPAWIASPRKVFSRYLRCSPTSAVSFCHRLVLHNDK